MSLRNIKLIIWDFDGVIADTEKLWLQNRQKLLNEELALGWDFETTNKYLGGMSDQTKKDVLDSINIKTDNQFWEKAAILDYKTMEQGFALTPDIDDIFTMTQFKQCIATGGVKTKTMHKIEITGIKKYFNQQNIFTVDMVEKGKPEPDLFLFAAKKMGFLPKECIVIEDSLAGMKAGLAAGMLTVAFIGCEMNNNLPNIQAIKQLGIKHIFADMIALKNFLSTLG
ncbi:MAG: HAD family phosphatase [Acetobacter sp.]|nr:HAD family phosphatase [Acetobacter sp.]